MPEEKTKRRARRDKKKGKAPTTQAGEFVREEFEHVKKGRHGAANRKQLVAIGLSKARKAGVKIPGRGKNSGKKKSSGGRKKTAPRRRSTGRKK